MVFGYGNKQLACKVASEKMLLLSDRPMREKYVYLCKRFDLKVHVGIMFKCIIHS